MASRRRGKDTSRWPSAARRSARCLPTRSAPTGTARTPRPPSIYSCGWPGGLDAVATYTILYWQEIPSQIKAEDALDDVTLPLGPRFMERIDQLAAQRGLQGSDEYLAQWRWSKPQEREG